MAPVEPDNHDHQDGTVGPLPGEIWSCFGPVLGVPLFGVRDTVTPQHEARGPKLG